MRHLLVATLLLSTPLSASLFSKAKQKIKKATLKTLDTVERKAVKNHVDRGGILSLRIKTADRFGRLNHLNHQEKIFLAHFDSYLTWISKVPKRGFDRDKFTHILKAIPQTQGDPLVKDATHYIVEQIVCIGTLGTAENLNYIEDLLNLVREVPFSPERLDLINSLIFPKFNLIAPFRIVFAAHFDENFLMNDHAQAYFDTWANRSIAAVSDDYQQSFLQIRYHDWLGFDAHNNRLWDRTRYIPSYLVKPMMRRIRDVCQASSNSLTWDANSLGLYLHNGKKCWYSGQVGYPKAHDGYRGYLYPLAIQIQREQLVARIVHHSSLDPNQFPE